MATRLTTGQPAGSPASRPSASRTSRWTARPCFSAQSQRACTRLPLSASMAWRPASSMWIASGLHATSSLGKPLYVAWKPRLARPLGPQWGAACIGCRAAEGAAALLRQHCTMTLGLAMTQGRPAGTAPSCRGTPYATSDRCSRTASPPRMRWPRSYAATNPTALSSPGNRSRGRHGCARASSSCSTAPGSLTRTRPTRRAL
mmetsp:Transcript_40242/g.113962  ORF Transcript_40242/g.113962 Transcript_40242/m.113962 type:complete len:202 (+) Transcript_40242:189-794(+)